MCFNKNKKLRERLLKLQAFSSIDDTSLIETGSTSSAEIVPPHSSVSIEASSSFDCDTRENIVPPRVEVITEVSRVEENISGQPLLEDNVSSEVEVDRISRNDSQSVMEAEKFVSSVKIVGRRKGIKMFKCDKCGKLFSKQVYASKHCSSAKKPWYCPICGTKVSHSQNVRRHNSTCIKRIASRPKEISKAQIICSLCSTVFFSNSNLLRHMRNSHGVVEGEYKCQSKGCNFVTSESKHLARHVTTIHSERVALQCPLCEYQCGSTSSILKHRAEIHGKRCLICKKMFLDDDKLKVHNMKFHRQPVVICRNLGEHSYPDQ